MCAVCVSERNKTTHVRASNDDYASAALCQGAAGLRDQLALFQVYHNFVLPHTSLRQPLRVSEATNGSGSAKMWRPCTPAMAAGLTDHVWTLQEVLLYRVPPWSQPQGV